MRRKLYLGRLIVCGLVFAWPAAAQLDSASLRAKFGSPLNRETYHLPSGFDFTVDYGANHQVCRLLVPALMPSDEKISNTDVMRQRMYAFLSELIPTSIRGKELRRGSMSTGAPSFQFVEYENISVGESQGSSSSADAITVTFKNDGCQKSADQ
jgi:hypothetical protein